MSITDTTLAEAEILLAQPRGFCAGVDRAIEIVERAIKLHGSPIYVRHEIVHNAYVVEDLRKKGAIFIEQLEEVPAGNTVIFSAHGVSKAVRAEAESRGLRVYDATCPLVTKVHIEVAKMRQDGFDIVMIGHKGHPEVEGTMGQAGEGMHLVEDIEDVQALRCRSRADRVRDANHAVGRRRCRNHRRAEGEISGDPRAEEAGHLLRHAKPPGRCQVHGAAMRRRDRGRQPEQFELEPVARSWPKSCGVPAYMVDSPDQIDPVWVEGKRRSA